METIQILDRKFRLSIPHDTIQDRVKDVAERLNKDYAGKNPVMVCILNGAYMFAADLARYLTFQPEIIFARFSSYEGMNTTGKVRELMGVSVSIHGRDVILVEDIVDTGITMHSILPQFLAKGAKSVKEAVLAIKNGVKAAEIKKKLYAACTLDEIKYILTGVGNFEDNEVNRG